MIRSFKKQYGKITSIILAIAMLVTGLPADLLGGIASVKADDGSKTYVFEANSLTVETQDQEVISEGTKLGTSDYFIAKGSMTKRGTKDSAATSVELVKYAGGTLNFTVEGTATVEFEVSSTGGTNSSTVALKKVDEEGYVLPVNFTPANDSSKAYDKVPGIYITYSSSQHSILKYENLEAGEYSIQMPVDTATTEDDNRSGDKNTEPYERNTRLFKVTVVETPSAGEGDDTSDGTDDGTDDGKDYIATSGAIDEYFTLTDGATDDAGNGKKYAQLWDGTVPQSTGRIKLGGKGGDSGNNAIKFTVRKGYTASVEVWGMSTNSDDVSQLALYDTEAKTVVAGPATAYNSKSTEKGYTDSDSEWGKAGNPITLTLSAEGLEGGKTYHIATPTDVEKEAAIYWIRVVDSKPSSVKDLDSYVLNPSTDIEHFQDTGVKQDGEAEKAGTEKFFTILYSSTTKVDSAAKNDWDDPIEFAATHRLNFGGTATTEKNSIKFTITKPMDVQVWWRVGAAGDERQIVVLDSEGNEVAASEGTWQTDKPLYNKFALETPGTYYLGNKGGNNYLFRVEVSKPVVIEEPRGAWEDVPDPVIGDAAVDEADASKIVVTAAGFIGYDGADSLTVDMIDAKGDVVATATPYKKDNAADQEQTFTFTPSASGAYTFKARLVREGEKDKVSKESNVVDFKLPLAIPEIKSVTNKGTTNGKGNLEVVWQKTPEAKTYKVTINSVPAEGETAKKLAEEETTQLKVTVGGLELNTTVEVSVVAIGRNGQSDPSTRTKLITGENDRTWAFSAWGSSVSLKSNDYKENADGSVTVWSEGGAGKIVPGSTDGLAFYYTAIDPSDNFTLTADVHVDSWTYSNGQDGFGMMVSDAVGDIGDGNAFWNNSYQLVSSKIEYRWDLIDNKVTDVVDLERTARYSMRLGLGWIAKQGVTATDVAKINLGEQTMPNAFSTDSGTLETSASKLGEGGTALAAGDYNIVGNGTSAPTTISEITDFKLQIKRNNTGYILSYLSPEPEKNEDGSVKTDKFGNIVYPLMDEYGSQIFYDDDRNILTQIDKRNIYVGFFAGRNARITVSNIAIETHTTDEDDPAEEKEITYVDPDFQITSSATANSDYYELIARGNMDGRVTIVYENTGEVLAQGEEVAANKKYIAGVTLQPDEKGENKFTAILVPNSDYVPGDYQKMTSLDPITRTFTVTYNVLEGTEIYVTKDGKSIADGGKGTKEAPLDIRSAVAYAKAGQTIYLAGGTYELGQTPAGTTKADLLLIDRNHSGTAKAPIYMVAEDPANRPVLDFTGQTTSDTAFTIVGDYWYLKGFDVTGSKDGQKAVQVSGDHNVLEDIHTYKNGNTGVQIARYQSDGREDWPSYNTILNCTSYLNADRGYEDADGFACKLTAGDGNRFVGCIAAYNADDGWDLFAKVESGSIGSVTIENCLAFKNGYVLTVDGQMYSDLDFGGIETTAGNGNGFKMGGDSMSGYHVLKNSIAFGNKAKGIDSNSCPDIQIYNSTSFDNESYNVAFYTNSAPNTDYYANGILSIKDSQTKSGGTTGEQLKPQGTQILSKIYKDTNYYFDGSKSVNSLGEEATVAWFKNTDMKTAIANWCYEMYTTHNATVISRDADGSINTNGFLELKDEYKDKGVGAVLGSTSVDNVFDKTAEVSVYASTVTKLREVKLTEELIADGYKWKYPETAVAVFAGTATEFIAVADGKSDVAVVVNFIDVTGVEFTLDQTADQKLIGDEKLTLEAVPVYAPAVDLEQLVSAQGDFTISSFEIKESSKLNLKVDSVDVGGLSKVKIAKDISRQSNSGEGLAKFTATLSGKIGNKTVKKQATCTFTTRNTDFNFEYTVDGADEVDGKITVDKNATFTLKELKVTGVGSNETVKVTGSDAKVIKISGSGSTYTINAVGEGTATITLTSAADKTVIKKISVTVKGAALKANVSELIMDKAKVEGVEINVIACYGNALSTPADSESVRVKSVLKGKTPVDKDYFTVTPVISSIYTLQITDKGASMSNGSYNVILEGYINGAYEEFEPIIVKVMETKPTVSIKQKVKPNLFYKAGSTSGYGNLTATSKLADVTLTQTNLSDSDFRLSATKTGYNVVLKASAQTKVENKQKLNSKIIVDVTYSGYREKYNRTGLVINVSTQKRAPKLKLEVDNKILYTQLGINDTEIRILDTATNTYVMNADVALASSTKAYVNANKNFDLSEDNMVYTLAASKSGSAKISVQDVDWNEEVILSQSITVNNKAPRATFAVTKLSSDSAFVGKEQSSALITVKNALDYTVRDLELTGTNAKATELLKYLDYSVDKNDLGQSVLLVSLKDTDDEGNSLSLPATLKKGTYTFNATFGLNKLTNQTAKVKVTLLPIPIVTTSQKGSIDLVNRTGSSVTVKPNLKNVNGTVVGMTLSEDASNLFEVEWDSAKGAAIVKAKEEIDMKKGGRYLVTPIFQVETEGGTVDLATARPITITPKQSNLKFNKISVMEARLSSANTPARAVVKAKSPANAEILEMVQMNFTDNFKVNYDFQSGALTVRIIDEAGLKAGSTYKIKVALDVKDAGVNSKMQQITIPVKVLK